MRILLVFVLGFIVNAGCATVAKASHDIREELYALTNLWGKADGVERYRACRQAMKQKLLAYEGGETLWRVWCTDFYSFLVKEPLYGDDWLEESGVETREASFSAFTRTSTNCWLWASGYAKETGVLLSKARQSWENRRSLASGTSMFDLNRSSRYQEAWVHLVAAEKTADAVFFAVTNVFPRWILPTLPPAEGAQLYTNVMRRAGLEPQRIEDLKPF